MKKIILFIFSLLTNGAYAQGLAPKLEPYAQLQGWVVTLLSVTLQLSA